MENIEGNNQINSNASHQSNTLRHQRITLLLVLGVFLLPVVVAYMLLATGWWQRVGTSNHGELIRPSFHLAPALHKRLVNTHSPKPWIILTLTNAACTASCQNALMLARQTQTLMGPDQHRVKIAVIHTAPLAANAQAFLARDTFSQLEQFKLNAQNPELNTLYEHLPSWRPTATSTETDLLIIDPLGNAVMRYPVSTDEKQAILDGRNFVKDLKQLLKLSRIG
ncbi:MAG: hypothetical protein P8176_08590 [Gammaproteobacteria bacterium]